MYCRNCQFHFPRSLGCRPHRQCQCQQQTIRPIIEDSFIASIKKSLPELPQQKKTRFISDYKLSAYDANVLIANQSMANYFESVADKTDAPAKIVANWIMGDFSAALNKNDLDVENSPITDKQFSELLTRIADNTISGKIAKTVFDAMWQQQGSADEIIEKQGLKQVTDTGAIEKIIDEVIASNPTQLEQYRAGKDKLFGFFVGQTMKASKGKANPEQVNALLKEKLK